MTCYAKTKTASEQLVSLFVSRVGSNRVLLILASFLLFKEVSFLVFIHLNDDCYVSSSV